MGKIIAMVMLTALAVVEHNGVKYGPGQDAGVDFEATEAEAVPLLQVKAVKLYDPNAVAADSQSVEQVAVDAQAVADARAKLDADIKAFEEAKAAAAEAVGAKSAKK